MNGVALAALSAAAWSSNYVAGRFLAAHGADPVALSLVRFALATPALFALSGPPRYRGGLGGLALAGLLGIAGFNLFLYASLHYVSAAAAALFSVAASPITYALAVLTGRDSSSLRRWAGVGLAVVGAYAVLSPYLRGGNLLGPALGLGASLCWALYTLYVPRLYAAYRPVEAMAWIALAGTLEMAPLLAVARFDWLAGPEALAALLYVALVPGALAYAAWNRAVQLAGPARTAAVLPLMPVFTSLLSLGLLGEGLSAMQAAGAAAAIAGVYLSQR